MNTRLRLLLVTLVALLVALVFAFPYWRPLFVREAAKGGFPGLAPEQQTAFQQLSATQQAAYQQLMPTDATMAVEMAQFALGPDNVVPTEEQGMPEMTDPAVLVSGSFTQVDPIHGAAGKVTIYELPDKSRVLRLEDFKATNGPGLHILLTRNSAPLTPQDVGNDYIDLGPLKGNVGNQNYSVPSEVDFSQYQGVVIYSLPFSMVFSTAKVS